MSSKLSPLSQTHRAFTLVELMIVIAIIGILAAALFPSLTGYLARGRDTARASDLRKIETGILSATTDKGGYLFATTGFSNWCSSIGSYWRTSFENQLKSYLPKIPHDPLFTATTPLSDTGADMDYLYAEGRLIDGAFVGTNGGLAQFVLGAHFEQSPPSGYTGAAWMVGNCVLSGDGTFKISQPYNGIKATKL